MQAPARGPTPRAAPRSSTPKRRVGERASRIAISCEQRLLGIETPATIYLYELAACAVPLGHDRGPVTLAGRLVRLPFVAGPLRTVPLRPGQQDPAELVQAGSEIDVDVVNVLDLRASGKQVVEPPPGDGEQPDTAPDAPDAALATHGSASDPLYLASRRYQAGQTSADALTGRGLLNWAMARGAIEVRAGWALRRMQEKPAAEEQITDEILTLLQDLLSGVNDPSQAVFGTGTTAYGTGEPAGPSARGDPAPGDGEAARHLSSFEGSANARGTAVAELTEHWNEVAPFLRRQLATRYESSWLDAYARAPGFWTQYGGERATLEDDPDEIIRIRRSQPHQDRAEFLVGSPLLASHDARGALDVVHIGDRWDRLHVVDLTDFVIWFDLDGFPTADGEPLWYYRAGIDILTMSLQVGAVMSMVARQAQFAALLLPAMIHYAGLILSFSPNPALMIAGVLLDEFGEAGMDEVQGREGPSAKERAVSAAKQIALNLVLHHLFGGGAEEGSAAEQAGEAGAAAEQASERAAAAARPAILAEIGRTEERYVSSALAGGRGRALEAAESAGGGAEHGGYALEVEIEHDGGRHIYRHGNDGTWCRWSASRVCDIPFSAETNAAARAAEAAVGRVDPIRLRRLGLRIEALEGTDAPAQLIDELESIESSSLAAPAAAARMRALEDRVAFWERHTGESAAEPGLGEATAQSEAARRSTLGPQAEQLQANKLSGTAGENRVEAEILSGSPIPELGSAATLLGSQVEVMTSAGKRVVDHLVELPSGEIVALEVKSGGAVRTLEQAEKDLALELHGGTIIGRGAPGAPRVLPPNTRTVVVQR